MAAIEVRQKNEGSGAKRHSWGGGFETVAALILGLATLGSAWSAYQSSLWGGIQNFRVADAHAAGRRAEEKAIYANEFRKIDAVLFERYLSALSEKDQRMANFLFDRFRPEFKVAAEAWLATNPLKNPSAPPGPFIMKEYSLEVEKEARQLRQEEEKKLAEAKKASEISHTYLLMTVLFSMVLFLGGIAAAFEKKRIRVVVLALGVLVLTAAAITLAFLPLANE